MDCLGLGFRGVLFLICDSSFPAHLAVVAYLPRIDPKYQLVFTMTAGRVDDRQMLDHEQAMKSHHAFDHNYNQLADATRIEDNQVTAAGLKTCSGMAPFNLTSKRVVVSARSLEFGMSRVYQAYASMKNHDVMVFPDFDPAFEYLKLMDTKSELFEILFEMAKAICFVEDYRVD